MPRQSHRPGWCAPTGARRELRPARIQQRTGMQLEHQLRISLARRLRKGPPDGPWGRLRSAGGYFNLNLKLDTQPECHSAAAHGPGARAGLRKRRAGAFAGGAATGSHGASLPPSRRSGQVFRRRASARYWAASLPEITNEKKPRAGRSRHVTGRSAGISMWPLPGRRSSRAAGP